MGEGEGTEGASQTPDAFYCLQAPVRNAESSVMDWLLQINETAALPRRNSVAKLFAKAKGWNLDIPFSCFKNLRTWDLVGFEIDGIN